MCVFGKETMGKPQMASAKSRWLILPVVLIIAVSSIVIAFWTGILFPRRVQKIYFSSCEWSEDQSHVDPFISLSIANTGADELIINRVWINGTLLDSSKWQSFPSMRFQPGDQGVLQITPPLEILKEGTTYQFTIETVAGNSFSHTTEPESLDFTFMKTEELKILSRLWAGASSYIDLNVKNTGSASLTMNSVQVNSVAPTAYDFDTGTPGNQTSQQLASGGTKTVRIWHTFISGVKYEFAILTAVGNKYTYISTAP